METVADLGPEQTPITAARGVDLLARAGWNGLGSVAGLTSQLLLTPYLLHRLGVDRYGIWALLSVIVTFVSAVDGGIGASLAYFFSLHRASRNQAASSRLVASACVVFLLLGGVLTVALGVGMPAILNAMDVPDALRGEALSLRFLVGGMVTAGFLLGVFTALLQAHDRYRAIGLVAAARAVAMIGGTVIVLEAGGGLRALLLVNLGALLSGLLASAALGRRYVRLQAAAPLRADEWRAVWAYGSRMQISSFTALVNFEVDAMIVGALLSVRYVGIYTIGANIALAVRMLPLFAMAPLLTRFAVRYGEGGVAAAAEVYRRFNPLWIAAVAVYAPIGAISLYFGVKAWLGPGHAESAYVGAFIFAGYGVNLLTGAASTFARSIGKPGLETRYALWSVAVNVALTVPLGIAFGFFGVLGATVVGTVIGSTYFFALLRREVHLDLGPLWSEIKPVLTLVTIVVVLVGNLLVQAAGLTGVSGLAGACLPGCLGLAIYAWFGRAMLVNVSI